jgi:hypothetical protein
MIYIFFGNDTKAKRAELSKISRGYGVVPLSGSAVTKETLINYASGPDLFDNSDNMMLLAKDLAILKESQTQFIFLEDKLLIAQQKKYEKYGNIQKFEEKVIKATPTINIFAIADAFGRREKVIAWTLYVNAIEAGIEPEAISGILFWKIKTLLLQNKIAVIREQLIRQSGLLVSLYHQAHQGKLDMAIGLEQFILSTLTK